MWIVKSIIDSHQDVVGASVAQVIELLACSVLETWVRFLVLGVLLYGNWMSVNNRLCELIDVKHWWFTTIDLPRQWFGMNGWLGLTVRVNGWPWKSALIQQSSIHPVSHSKLMCERMDPFTRQLFPQTTMGDMSPEQIGNSSPTKAPLIGKRRRRRKWITHPLPGACGYRDMNPFLQISVRSCIQTFTVAPQRHIKLIFLRFYL